MPNILLKRFLKSPIKNSVDDYVFPEADELETDEPETADAEGESSDASAEKSSDTAGPIEFASIQAEKIMEDAQQRAETLARERLEQAEKEIEAAKEEAKTEGYRQGYAEGLQQARVEASAKLEEQLRQEARQVAEFLEKASGSREQLIQDTQDELCDLSMAIAEKVIHISLKSSREVIARMIQVVTEKMKRREWVHIYVGGCGAAGLAQITPELTVALASLSDHIKIIPMADDESGTCIIETPDEIIDASVSTQLQNIKDVMKER